MPCNHCMAKFNFFNKEVGCGYCGLSFCSKCLKQKSQIPNKGGAMQSVCRTCYHKINSGTSTSTCSAITPPDIYIKRLETLDNPIVPAITVHKDDSKMQEFKCGLALQDIEILERLEKLKDCDKGPPPSESEIRQRLAKLKGENNYDMGSSKESCDTFLEQFFDDHEIKLAQNPQDEIEARLASLREQGVRPNEGQFVKNMHDSSSSEDEVEWITKKIMDEVALDNQCPVKFSNTTTDDSDLKTNSPLLPWCVLCNNDAKFQCLDCGGDLYCSECNIEAHKNWGDYDHRVIPFNSSK